MAFNYPIAPENPRADETYLKTLVRVVNQIMRGKTNNTGEVTLTASAASTDVDNINVSPESTILFQPLTANAASEYAAGTMYVSSFGKQTFTITHANNAQTDRDFKYAVIG